VGRARPTEEEVLDAMLDVVDPELMVNVVDLGLVYGVHIDENNWATLDMTLTSPTCPLTDRLEYDTNLALEGLVSGVTINWVWLPPWTLDNITEEGREQLRAIGYNL
jgi:metal-sulfur cluster biosynthetic enzyme